MALNLRQKQTEGIVCMLNLNEPLNPNAGGTANEDVYKILIFDKFCQEILSTLIHVNDLRKHGVILYLLIDDDRDPVADVAAVYFVRPTSHNIKLIIADASKCIYDYTHLNFCNYVPGPLLEDLASGTFNSDSPDQRIYKLHDQYLEFVTLEDNLFSLANKNCYAQLNDPSAGDEEIVEIIENIVSGLFCVLATLAVFPVIRCPRGGPAELVAYRLNQRLQDHLLARNDLFIEGDLASSEIQPPVLLCLFDRNFDLSVAVQHDFRYRPLVHDVLGLRLNKLSVHNDDKGMLSYELDTRSDSFWVNNESLRFDDVAFEIESQLRNYKKDVEQVNRKLQAMTAVSSLPELKQRKIMINKHTNIATALSGEINKRSLDSYAEIEKDMMLRRGGIDHNELLGVLNGMNGTKTDKLRFAITYLISTTENNIPQSENVEMVEAALRECEIDTSAFEYVKKIKKKLLNHVSPLASSSAISAVTAGVKNLLSDDHDHQLPLTRTVKALMEGKPNPEIDESYLVFDPKSSSSSSDGATSSLKGGPFKEAIVFMIGGGNYVEYASLQELALHQQQARHIIYGTTEILSGGEFVEQLSFLGHKMGLGSSSSS